MALERERRLRRPPAPTPTRIDQGIVKILRGPIQRGEEFIPGNVIIGAHYGAWAVISLIILIWGI